MGNLSSKKEESLYTRLGGKSSIQTVTKTFYANLFKTPEAAQLFGGVNMDFHIPMFAEFICQATGGPEKYTGRSMKEAHAGLNLNDGHWDLVCNTLVATLKEMGV